jgi:hypothetical protein
MIWTAVAVRAGGQYADRAHLPWRAFAEALDVHPPRRRRAARQAAPGTRPLGAPDRAAAWP